ncbi:MAG: T9SS type A sorting domain-containing protein, partial [Flavobacteriales bacterium]|nr:T9SS type A sorting domain-containing protein [Flavobacteriales bacterium]
DLYTDTIVLSNSGTGISEAKDCEIELFTTRNTIQLLSSNYCPSDDYILEIYDLSGRLINTGKVNSSSTLNTTDLNTGIYIYQVRGSEKVYSGKVVISN